MPSILPKYEYDIFISYRQNDNQEGWVTRFVESLRQELKSLFKEEITLYFDSDPNHGLHETHDVDGSLKEKVKCLVFIPIVSQTYCDPKAFAWQKEFLSFLEFAKQDEFGLDVKVSGGNVSKRVLPVRIHELDAEDQKLFEEQVGGVMRPVDFIYKEAGVNRPLRIEDNRSMNLENTDFRNQVNKVANAIKELLLSAQGKASTVDSAFSDIEDVSNEFSLAVLPFANLSNDANQNYFSDGMSDEIVSALTQIPEVRIAGRTSSFSFKGKNEDLITIGKKLNVKNIIEGSIRVIDSKVRINVQLVDCQSGFNLWSERYDEEVTDIFSIQEKIALSILDKLKVTFNKGDEKRIRKSYTKDLDIYNQYLNGRFHYNQRSQEGITKALKIFESILTKDPEFAPAYATMSDCYRLSLIGYLPVPRELALQKIKEVSKKALELDPDLDTVHASLGHTYMLMRNLNKSVFHLQKALQINPNNVEAKQALGWVHISKSEYETASHWFKLALQQDPYSAGLMTEAGWPYLYNSQHDKAIEFFQKAVEIDPNYALAYFDWGNILLLKGQNKEGFSLINKAIDLWGNISMMLGVLAHFKARNGDLDTANKILETLLEQNENGLPAAFSIADVYEGMGNKSEALKWLTIAEKNREVMIPLAYQWRKGHLESYLLLDDPEFVALVEKARAPEDFLID